MGKVVTSYMIAIGSLLVNINLKNLIKIIIFMCALDESLRKENQQRQHTT